MPALAAEPCGGIHLGAAIIAIDNRRTHINKLMPAAQPGQGSRGDNFNLTD
jgi:hypothetical protein